MDRKTVLAAIIILVIISGVATALLLIQNTKETPPATKVTLNETRVVVNKTVNETPQTNISEEEAKRIAEAASADLGFPGTATKATLFYWSEKYSRDWDPRDQYRTWVWNVSMTYTNGSQRQGNLWVDAQTGEIIMN